MSMIEAVERYKDFHDADLLNELGHVEYKQEKFLEGNKLGLLDPDKAKEDVEYWNGLARDANDIETALEARGWCRDTDTGEWFDDCGEGE